MITEEQRRERMTGLGGSDIAPILGISPWTRPIDVWLEKKGRADETPRRETEAMWWGNEEESLVARRFTELTGLKLVNYNFTIHDGCLIANIDRLVVPEDGKVAAHQREIRTDAFAEIKTAGGDWPDAGIVETLPNGTDVLDGEQGIPTYYQAQIFHYFGRLPTCRTCYVPVKMAIPRRSKSGAMFAMTEFRIYRLDRDDAIIKAQDEFARDWWRRFVEGDETPEAETEEDARRIWRVSKPGTSIVATAELLGAWRRLMDAKDAVKTAEAAESAAKAEIEKAMGENESIVGPDEKTVLATWKSAKDRVKTTVDWEKLARSKGVTDEEIAAATTTETKPGARTLLLKSNAKVCDYVDAQLAESQITEEQPKENVSAA